jgi:hypothetical protein
MCQDYGDAGPATLVKCATVTRPASVPVASGGQRIQVRAIAVRDINRIHAANSA